MNPKEILRCCDHTNLCVDITLDDMKKLCDEGLEYHCASVCLPPRFVKSAKEYSSGALEICTVIGFPNGYNTTASKCFEAEDALKNGADEIDMVIPICDVKDKKYSDILEEINKIKETVGCHILKVIVETCKLTEAEKIKLCEIVSLSGADYIKTSTGFSNGGATVEDIELFSRHIFGNTKIKAAGGIKTLRDAEMLLKAGASRLGTSRIVALVKEEREAKL